MSQPVQNFPNVTNVQNFTLEHFFDGLNINRPSKLIAVFAAVLLMSLNSLALVGIIWFERFGSDLKRIFINRIVTSVAWSSMSWYILVQTTDMFLYFYRPLPELICFTNLVVRNTIIVQTILFFDSIVVVRYVAIFWMKDPENFKDDFWFRFVNCWIVSYR